MFILKDKPRRRNCVNVWYVTMFTHMFTHMFTSIEIQNLPAASLQEIHHPHPTCTKGKKFLWAVPYFPCQVRISRFFQTCFLLVLLLLPSRISTARAGSQWAHVGTAGPQTPKRMPEKVSGYNGCQIECQIECQSI